jgi:ABC-type nitrate/sulfonate/bicarbonate transport system permease component
MTADLATGTAPKPRTSPPRKRLKASGKGAARRRAFISFGAVFVVWELIGRFVVTNELFFVSISAIFNAAVDLAESGQLWRDTRASLIEFLLGFAAASLAGIVIGGLNAMSTPFRNYVEPWVSAMYATPIIAIGPLFILWFGLGMTSKVAVIFLTAVFPVIINTQAGLANTDRNLLEAVRSFGASRWQLFLKVRLPSSLPFIIAGERLAIARALVGVVVAELFGAREGLGYLIFVSSQTFRTADLFVGVFILAGSGIVAVQGLKWLEERLTPWRTAEETD